MLFLFGRDDDEQNYGHDPVETCRVLYAVAGVLTQREAPDDLPPVGGTTQVQR